MCELMKIFDQELFFSRTCKGKYMVFTVERGSAVLSCLPSFSGVSSLIWLGCVTEHSFKQGICGGLLSVRTNGKACQASYASSHDWVVLACSVKGRFLICTMIAPWADKEKNYDSKLLGAVFHVLLVTFLETLFLYAWHSHTHSKKGAGAFLLHRCPSWALCVIPWTFNELRTIYEELVFVFMCKCSWEPCWTTTECQPCITGSECSCLITWVQRPIISACKAKHF